jgi:rubrerythrin
MSKEQETTLSALQTAIKMEIDGKAFYITASKASTNKMGKELLKKLAGEEDIHRKVFENIFKTLGAKKEWPDQKITFDGGKGLRTIFSMATETMRKETKAIPTELDAIQTAMGLENNTYDFYNKRAGVASYGAEKEFYEAIAAQEKEHHRILLDYYEFLKNPAAWFVQKEHPSIDGG